ncbi:MAG: shikimate dehydrogenase [Akkermansia sp.]|nr:shikimate dehydrogenase [Akkermansia sp.]
MSAYYTTDEIAQLRAQEPVALGVIGNPIAHSKSPQMQQAALDNDGRPYRYVRLLAGMDDGEFEALLRQLEALNFIGVNVTVPFKKKALAASREADTLSTLCGAANTLKRHPEGGWTAINTDGPGFAAAIQELSGNPLNELRVMILGACGGAGSALAAQCVLSECRSLCLVNRPRPELQQMATKLATQYTGELSTCHFNSQELEQAAAQADLIVNATSLGLKEGDPLPLPAECLRPGQMVYDIVTHDTPLRRAAAERGCLTDNGLAMLLWQGAYAYNYWFGSMPDINCMRTALQQA